MISDSDMQKTISHLEKSVSQMYSADSECLNAKAEYQMSKDSCLFETRDMLRKMQEASDKESALQTKRFIIQTVLSVASLIVATIAAVASIISLL